MTQMIDSEQLMVLKLQLVASHIRSHRAKHDQEGPVEGRIRFVRALRVLVTPESAPESALPCHS
jgi:hypothetical protein